MTKDRKILITNDDGITADGIIRLAAMAKKYGQVWVLAPESQRSAMSHSITLRDTIDIWEHEFPVDSVSAFACSGTPGDCIRVGSLNIVPGKPDIVFSGINFGYNCASDIQYSATVGAALEASFQGIPAIAFSEGTKYHEVTDAYLEHVLDMLIDEPYVEGQILNVNFPNCQLGQFAGILQERTMSKKLVFSDSYTEESLAGGIRRFKVYGQLQTDAEEGSDYEALLGNYISIGKVANLQEPSTSFSK